ncbi:tetratricopeptide repeat protein [Spirochaetota bacterium]
MILQKEKYYTKVFYSQADFRGWKAVVKGKIISISARQNLDKNDLSGQIQMKSKATVRLYNSDGIKEGDTLFVVNKKNLIVSRMKVQLIFKSKSLGYLIVGFGQFTLASLGDRVVQKVEDEFSRYAYIHKSRGDYFIETGEQGRGIKEYKKAIKLDKRNPDANLALGMIYYKQGLYKFAYKYFVKSYENLNRLYDNEDKYNLLIGLTEICYRECYYSYLPSSMRIRFRKEGIKYSSEALNINKHSIESNFFLGMFHYRTKKSMDRKARDYFLRVLELNPAHVEANIALSELYFKHKNREKAKKYAQSALKSDPSSRRARQMLRYILRYNK